MTRILIDWFEVLLHAEFGVQVSVSAQRAEWNSSQSWILYRYY